VTHGGDRGGGWCASATFGTKHIQTYEFDVASVQHTDDRRLSCLRAAASAGWLWPWPLCSKALRLVTAGLTEPVQKQAVHFRLARRRGAVRGFDGLR